MSSESLESIVDVIRNISRQFREIPTLSEHKKFHHFLLKGGCVPLVMALSTDGLV